MEQKSCELTINEEVIAKIASTAAMEIDGVASMCENAPALVRGILGRVGVLKPVEVRLNGDVINLDVSIRVQESAHAKTVAETVQENVKEKVQNMTGSVVTKVNVHVSDLQPEPDSEK